MTTRTITVVECNQCKEEIEGTPAVRLPVVDEYREAVRLVSIDEVLFFDGEDFCSIDCFLHWLDRRLDEHITVAAIKAWAYKNYPDCPDSIIVGSIFWGELLEAYDCRDK